jgi:hypothetical protein
MCKVASMVKTLDQAVALICRLPVADQEQIGRKLLSHVEKLNALRAEMDHGIHSLDANKDSAVNMVRQKNSRRQGA